MPSKWTNRTRQQQTQDEKENLQDCVKADALPTADATRAATAAAAYPRSSNMVDGLVVVVMVVLLYCLEIL